MLSVIITRTVLDKLGFMVTITITIINILFFFNGRDGCMSPDLRQTVHGSVGFGKINQSL